MLDAAILVDDLFVQRRRFVELLQVPMIDLRDLQLDADLQARHAAELAEHLLAELDRLVGLALMGQRFHPRPMDDDLLLQVEARLGEQLRRDGVDQRPAIGLLADEQELKHPVQPIGVELLPLATRAARRASCRATAGWCCPAPARRARSCDTAADRPTVSVTS